MTLLDFALVDPHVHLWDPFTTPRALSRVAKLLGPWPAVCRKVAEKLAPPPARDFVGRADYVVAPYLPSDHARGAEPFTIDAVVHIEAGWRDRRPLGAVGETRWLETLDFRGAAMELGRDRGPRGSSIVEPRRGSRRPFWSELEVAWDSSHGFASPKREGDGLVADFESLPRRSLPGSRDAAFLEVETQPEVEPPALSQEQE